MELIAKLFPGWALKRELSKLQRENLKRAYESGKPTDFHKVLTGSEISPNSNMQSHGEKMRSRARHYDENYDLVTGLFDTLEQYVIGNGHPIRPLVRNPDGTLNALVNQALIANWKEWSLDPTLSGGVSMLNVLKSACRAWLRDGEFLTRFVRGTIASGRNRKVPLLLELIEPDYLPYNKERTTSGVAKIIQGVEVDRYGRKLAYHLLKEHPEDNLYNYLADDTRRIPADDILHLKFTRRVNQIRGVTLLHSVLNRIDDLKDYEESERIAARVAAAMTGYIKKPGDQMGKPGADGGRTFEMSPGMVFDNLLPGEEIGTIASNRPNPELMNFRSAMIKAIAAGTRTNASTIGRDYSGTYSSQRQELLEAKPAYEGLRQSFVDQYLGPIWREFVSMQLAVGSISTRGINPSTIDDIEIRGVNIGWIDPQKQANSTETEINLGITTRGQVIRDRGGDPAAVFSELEEEKRLFDRLNPQEETQDQETGDNEESEQDQE